MSMNQLLELEATMREAKTALNGLVDRHEELKTKIKYARGLIVGWRSDARTGMGASDVLNRCADELEKAIS